MIRHQNVCHDNGVFWHNILAQPPKKVQVIFAFKEDSVAIVSTVVNMVKLVGDQRR